MLELNLAPTPNPAASPPSPGPAAEPQSAPASGSQSDSPFAAVLKNHVKPAAQAKDAKPADPKDKPAAVAIEPPVDALALLAPMLAGLVPAQAAPAPATPTLAAGDTAEDASSTGAETAAGGDPAAGAAAIALALAAQGTSQASQTASARAAADAAAQSDTPAALSAPDQPKAGAALPLSANLAAAATATPESSADGGKSGPAPESFQSLLNAANDARILAGHHADTQRAAHAAEPAPSASVATPVGAHGWDSEVGEKVSWMVGRQETRAELVLNPPQFGRIEVSLSLNGDQASAVFTSANPTVREALENAMPRLREILQDAGISLGQSQVGAESFRQSAGQRENGDNSPPGQGRGENGRTVPAGLFTAGSAPAQWLRRGNGMVDTFA